MEKCFEEICLDWASPTHKPKQTNRMTFCIDFPIILVYKVFQGFCVIVCDAVWIPFILIKTPIRIVPTVFTVIVVGEVKLGDGFGVV